MTTEIALADDRRNYGIPPDNGVVPGLFRDFPGPAMRFDGKDRLCGINDTGNKLVDFLLLRPEGTLTETLIGICRKVCKGQIPSSHMFSAEIDGTSQWIDAALFPDASGGVLVLGRYATIDVNMRTALIASRQLYKDLVEVSSDFAWETDAKGVFTFVSPRGAMGFPANAIVGRAARDFLFVPDTAQQDFAFESRIPLERTEIWLRDAGGHPVCLLSSAKPLFDQNKQFSGVRGVCRDITDDRMRENDLTRHKAREQVIEYIVDAVRNEAKPDNMLKTAVRSVCRALTATSCAVYRADIGGELVSAARFGPLPRNRNLLPAVNALDMTQGMQETRVGSYRLLVEPTHYRGASNGATILCRDADAAPWEEDDRLLLQAVAGQLGIALQQIAEQQELVRLSRTDPLTGLLNRRAFMEELERAMERTARNRASSAILYLDLNNFKHVNDTQGHDGGDKVLKQLAEILLHITRSYDFVARLGGDEFAVWLENVDKATARRRATAVLGKFRPVARDSSKNSKKRLGLSVGIAVYEHNYPEAPQALMARADEAMYRAKNNNKQDIAIARHRTDASMK